MVFDPASFRQFPPSRKVHTFDEHQALFPRARIEFFVELAVLLGLSEGVEEPELGTVHKGSEDVSDDICGPLGVGVVAIVLDDVKGRKQVTFFEGFTEFL